MAMKKSINKLIEFARLNDASKLKESIKKILGRKLRNALNEAEKNLAKDVFKNVKK